MLRSNITLTESAMGEIVQFYGELRGAEDADALPITVRSLETIIRLSTAVAKCRLAKGEPRKLPQAWARVSSACTRCLLLPASIAAGSTTPIGDHMPATEPSSLLVFVAQVESASDAQAAPACPAGVEHRDVAVAVDLIKRMKARELDAEVGLNVEAGDAEMCARHLARHLHVPSCCAHAHQLDSALAQPVWGPSCCTLVCVSLQQPRSR